MLRFAWARVRFGLKACINRGKNRVQGSKKPKIDIAGTNKKASPNRLKGTP
jgi:hypothetical protein